MKHNGYYFPKGFTHIYLQYNYLHTIFYTKIIHLYTILSSKHICFSHIILYPHTIFQTPTNNYYYLPAPNPHVFYNIQYSTYNIQSFMKKITLINIYPQYPLFNQKKQELTSQILFSIIFILLFTMTRVTVCT